MIVLYLIFGFLALVASGSSPVDPLYDIQADKGRPARRGEIAAAVFAWCVALSVWPLALGIRGVLALWAGDRRSSR